MSDPIKRAGAPRPKDNLDITRTIRRLSLPIAPAGIVEQHEHEQRSALLVCCDSHNKKWGPRWLRQTGFETILAPDRGKALEVATSTQPDVIIVEAGLDDGSGIPLFKVFQDAGELSAPVIVLCSSTKETSAALDAGAFDVVRKPFEWQLISRRAMYAERVSGIEAQLDRTRESLSEALDLADSARQRLRSRESFEPVTGLPNKSKFTDLLKRGMRAVDSDDDVLAVFVIGFNRFRLVVEAMGQDHADLVLTEIGKKLSDCMRHAGSAQAHTTGLRTAAAASMDSARFGLMLTCSGGEDELTNLQQLLVEKLSRPVQISGQTVYLSACVGVALYPHDASDVDSLLQRAENAMRDAQSRGGGFKFYCAETDAAAARKLKIEHMLHEALDRAELTLAYQPITEATGGRVTGAEALLRWQQPDKTFLSPTEFVPIAEESGLMIRVGKFVLECACSQLKTWYEEGFNLPHMCVNVSKVQLMSGDFVKTVERSLKENGLNPACLELELSERGVLSGDYDVISQLHALKRLGVRLSIDDFGTGDSAIAYLKELPIDVLKIDRSYIDGLTKNRKDAAIISAMVALGQRLELKVVAEGVETREQLAILQELGCDEVQGFYVSEPVSSDEFTAQFKKHRRE